MEISIRLVELGRSARNEAKIKNRQPLRKMLAKSTIALDDYYRDIIASELNIKEVEFKDDLSEYTSYIFKPQLKTVGPKYGKLLNGIKEYLLNTSGSELYSELKNNNKLTFKVNGEEIELAEEDLLIEASKKEGFITAIDGQLTVVLDTVLDEELIEEGYVREIVSKIQTMRKESNFDVLDKIKVYISNNEKVEKIIEKHKNLLLRDIMASDLIIGKLGNDKDIISKEWSINDENVNIGIKK